MLAVAGLTGSDRGRAALRGPAGWILANLVLALLYAGLGAAAGRFFAAYGLFPAPIWLPAGIAAVASMIGGVRMLPGNFVGSMLVNYGLLDSAFATAALISVGNCLGPYLGAVATMALRPPTGLFTRFRGVIGFVVGSVALHATITGLIGTAALVLAGITAPGEEAFNSFSRWWLCDAGGVFFFAPALMLWLGAERTPAVLGRRASFADGVVLVATAAVAALLFALPRPLAAFVRPEAVFLLTVPLTWITLRVSLRAAYTLLTVISVVATVGTLAELGPFQAGGVTNPLRAVGFMIVLMASNALTLMALVSERREAEAQLAASNEHLTQEVAAQTAELRKRAETDDLTGVGNRGHFLRRLDEEFAAAQGKGAMLSLLVLDLDHFRPLNDTRGHAAGDDALRMVAQLCLAQLGDMQAAFGRLGGEIFAAVLPGATVTQAAAVAEAMRAAVARHSFSLGDEAAPARLTASFGVTELQPSDRSAQDLLRRADAGVFLAKAKGRNRVEIRVVSELPREMQARNLGR